MKCSICHGLIAGEGGHNPDPICHDVNGDKFDLATARCCDTCNGDVLYARITGKEPYDNRTVIRRRSASGVSSTQSNRELS